MYVCNVCMYVCMYVCMDVYVYLCLVGPKCTRIIYIYAYYTHILHAHLEIGPKCTCTPKDRTKVYRHNNHLCTLHKYYMHT